MHDIDETDMMILLHLAENSRLTISELADLTGKSRPTINSHIKKLEEMGVIKRYTITIDEGISDGMRVILMAKGEPERIRDIEGVERLYEVGEGRYILTVWIRNLDQLMNLMTLDGIVVEKILPVRRTEILTDIPPMRIKFRCHYCQKELTDNPVVEKVRNRILFFCCNTCRRDFLRSQM